MGIKDDKLYMSLALEQAKIAQNIDEIPVGCIIVKDEKIIASGYNRQIIDNNPTSHAEIIALKNAGKYLKNHRLINTTLYTTLEPCTMCFGAIIHARIKRIVYATTDNKTGACGGCMDLVMSKCFNHKIEITAGILNQECKDLLQNFFKQKRL